MEKSLPDYKEAKRRTKEEVKVITDAYIIDNELSKLGTGKTYCTVTYGCQANVRDSETISAIMEDMSFTRVEDMKEADVVIFNTCAIRENAHNKVFGNLGIIKNLKEKKEILTIFCGCMAKEESVIKMLT